MKSFEMLRILRAAYALDMQLTLDNENGIEYGGAHAMGEIAGNYVLVYVVIDALGYPDQPPDCEGEMFCRDYLIDAFHTCYLKCESHEGEIDPSECAAIFLDWLESDLAGLRIEKPELFVVDSNPIAVGPNGSTALKLPIAK